MSPPGRRPSLVAIITFRLVATAVLAMTLHIGVIALRNYLNQNDLADDYVNSEASAVARQLYLTPTNQLIFRYTGQPRRYFDKNASAYAFRIFDADGRLVRKKNHVLLATVFPGPTRVPNQEFWRDRIDADQWLHIAGGKHVTIGGRDAWIEVVTVGDPARVYLSVLRQEIIDDVWLPIIPLVVLLLGVATLSIRHSLRPLSEAATRADSITPLDEAMRFDTAGLPREAASFAAAINRLLDRAAGLVKAQRMFIAGAAHELRTPLAIMLLELERNEDAGVRKLESDVRLMSEAVDRMLMLARLESMEHREFEEIDAGEIACETAERCRAWAAENAHDLSVHVLGPVRIEGDAIAVREAVRNLIDNAVKHTPRGTSVRVSAGPGRAITVEDSGPGFTGPNAAEFFEPFRRGHSSSEGAGLGLAIVRQAVALHGGAIVAGRSEMGGARIELRFS